MTPQTKTMEVKSAYVCTRYIYMHQKTTRHIRNSLIVHIGDRASSGRGSSSRSRLRGTQGGRVYTRRKFRARPGSVARALGVRSHASWQEITGSLSAEPEPCRTTETPYSALLLLLYQVCITPSRKLSRSLLWGSHGTTAVAHQALPYVTAKDSASVCARARARHVSYRNEHIISREVQGCCAGRRAT